MRNTAFKHFTLPIILMYISSKVSSMTKKKQIKTIFVYGTLKKQERVQKTWGIIPSRVKNGRIGGVLYKVKWYPMLLETKSNRYVRGKVLSFDSLDNHTLKMLDKYEGVNEKLYFRHRKVVTLNSGRRVPCWVYIGNPKHPDARRFITNENIIKSGIWRETSKIEKEFQKDKTHP